MECAKKAIVLSLVSHIDKFQLRIVFKEVLAYTPLFRLSNQVFLTNSRFLPTLTLFFRRLGVFMLSRLPFLAAEDPCKNPPPPKKEKLRWLETATTLKD